MTSARVRPRGSHTVTCLASISLRNASAHRPVWLDQSFRPDERRAVALRPARSIAGMLAAKKAAVELCSRLFDRPALTERDFVVTHRATGAPRIEPVARGLRTLCGSLLVSISHSRTTACAVVCASVPAIRTAHRHA